jgi:hypothetical protein
VKTVHSALAEDIRGNADEARTNGSPHAQTFGSVLSAIADVMSDTIARFEEISARITQIVLTKGRNAHHELIVELQAFDRLQQEFAAFSKAIARCAAAGNELPWNSDQDARLRSEVIAAITVSELRVRLLRRFEDDVIMDLTSSPDEETIF